MAEDNLSRNPKVRELCRQRQKFSPDAYELVREAVVNRNSYLNQPHAKQHISGQVLLEVIRIILIQRYGPFAIDMLHHWNISSTEDFGAIVFDLVKLGFLGVSPEDSIHDFDNGYDFIEAFVLPFR